MFAAEPKPLAFTAVAGQTGVAHLGRSVSSSFTGQVTPKRVSSVRCVKSPRCKPCSPSFSMRAAAPTNSKRPTVVHARSSSKRKPAQTREKPPRDLDLCICHATADFDSLAAAVGLARLRGPGTKVVIPAGEHEAVQRYLSLHRGLFPLIDVKAVDPDRVRWVGVVDAHSRKRLGPAAEFVDVAEAVDVLDHHAGGAERCDIAGELSVNAVGAVSTVVVERLKERAHEITLTPAEATLLALAIHTDTGNLCWETTTKRDATALAWCLEQGASQRSIAQFARNYLTPEQQRLLSVAIDSMLVEQVDGAAVASVVLETDGFVKGMAGVAQVAMELSNADVLLLAHMSPASRKGRRAAAGGAPLPDVREDGAGPPTHVSLIGRARARVEGVDFGALFAPLGGGGHAKAASASIRAEGAAEVQTTVEALIRGIIDQLPEPALVRDFMSTALSCVSVADTMGVAREKLFELGHTGLPVVADRGEDRLVGVVSRQDIALAERRGKLDTPVKGWISKRLICATEDTPLHEAEAMLADNKIGRLPVVRDGKVVGIVTRSDILVQRRLLVKTVD